MRHLEDDSAKEFRNAPPHMLAHGAPVRARARFIHLQKRQLGDKQSGKVRDGARERKNEKEGVTKVQNEM